MRLMVMFDLPVETSAERRAYRQFRKGMIREGFFMMQYSIYVRVCPNRKSAQFLEQRIANLAPEAGVIQTMLITEAQYQAVNFIAGKASDDIRNSPERTIVI
ncbi:CRISPR-associated endonuclease Cas2 [Lacticaseibacillus mingshuiensis]|uniref:CRISPR-associated endoribonuclease Cas2 n=1 Tax=Lacticaseibacillus mingshuiensis TaxID=2799574 RepID=A0ABW4CHL8_9LACO|nr:CRISPR-associated endonuclease Cas2 [Lacticaseibacillus mingshuiensis]